MSDHGPPAPAPAAAYAALAAAGAMLVGTVAGLRAYADGPPPGHTGGFGEPTCAECHRNAPQDPEGVRLSVEGLPERYRPGERYELTVRLEAPGLRRGGFQLAVRHLSGCRQGRQGGELAAASPGVEVVTDGPAADSAAGPLIHYARQTLDGSLAGEGADASAGLAWAMTWTAPAAGKGGAPCPVAVDVAANASNDDASEFGDRVVSKRVVVPGPRRAGGRCGAGGEAVPAPDAGGGSGRAPDAASETGRSPGT